MNQWVTEYRGYILRRYTSPEAHWKAFWPGSSEPWFEAPTETGLHRIIDNALAGLPPPLY